MQKVSALGLSNALVWVVFVVVEDVAHRGRLPRGGVRVSRTLEP
jgi:hypothetical protein